MASTVPTPNVNSPPRLIALVLGPVLAFAAGLGVVTQGLSSEAGVVVGVTVLCIVWWVFEPVPIPVTSLVPIAILPMSGALPQHEVSAAYGHPVILLLLGGFILSTAMEKSGADRRIALTVVRAFGGTSSRRLVFGFMTVSALLSMWISNTATTLMLLPVALATLERAREPRLTAPLLLGIGFAANVGGIGTPIGTPPNLVFMGIYESMTGNTVSFLNWMTLGVPVVLVFVPVIGLWLTRNLSGGGGVEIPDPGVWRTEERRVLVVFAVTAFFWMTREQPFGGWSALLDVPFSNDGVVALLAVVVMFLVPNGNGGRLLDWETAQRIPWGMLILFGSGLAIAKGFASSGLSEAIGLGITGLSSWHPYLLILGICLVVTFLTEMTSNTATTSLLLPILAATAIGANLDPRLMMIPAAMSASCAFMLPVATGPNVVIFTTGRITIQEMAREGFALNLFGVLIIGSMCYLLIN